MKRITRWSIRAHLLLLVGLAVLPALCILLYTGLEQQREAGSRARQVSVRQAFHLAELQEGSLVGTRQLLSVLAEVPQIRDRNGPAGTAIFKKLVEQNPRYDNLLAALPDGRIYASAFGTRPAEYPRWPPAGPMFTGALGFNGSVAPRENAMPSASLAEPYW